MWAHAALASMAAAAYISFEPVLTPIVMTWTL
jgi:hypothetical protein